MDAIANDDVERLRTLPIDLGDKPPVPTRSGEVPLLAAQRRR
jgi:hypothetical protein